MILGEGKAFCFFYTLLCFQWLYPGMLSSTIHQSVQVELKADKGQLLCSMTKPNEMGTSVKFRWNIYGLDKKYLDQLTVISDPQSPISMSELSVQKIQHNFIFRKISCFVSFADMLTNQDPIWGPETQSNEIQPAVEYSSDPIKLVESSDTHTVKLRTQSNFGTKTSCSSCKVNIEVVFMQTVEQKCLGTDIPDVVLFGNCSQTHSLADFMTGIELTLMATIENLDEYKKYNDYNEYNQYNQYGEKTVYMNVIVVNNEDQNLLQVCHFRLSVFDHHPLYLCQVVNDPHIYPFEEPYYDFMERGVYLLYKRKSQMFEVYAKAVTCYEGYPNTCNKEVAIISEDDVVYFRKDIAVEVYSKDNRISSKIYRKGHESYMVLFPTGTSVIVETDFEDTLKVIIQKSHYDDDNTTGLCDVTDMEEKSSLWSKTGALFNFTGTSPQNAIECACLAHRAPVCNQGHLVYRCEEQYDDITKDLLKAAVTTPFNWSKST